MRKLAVSLLGLVLLTGCIPFTNHGTKHYVIVGFGIVSVNTNNTSLTVVKSTSVGLGVSTLASTRCIAGFNESLTVMASTNQSVVIEIDKTPGKPFRIEQK